MTLTLESIKDGQPVAKQVEVCDVLKHIVTTAGWPEVIVQEREAYTIEEFDDQTAVYRHTESYNFDL